jgi:hypothetical protein
MEKYKYKWRYEDNERPYSCSCWDCGMAYSEFPDMLVPDKLWKKINPTIYKGAGILCPTCIANRLDYINCWYDDNLFILGERPNKLIRLYRKWRTIYQLHVISKNNC